MIDITSNNEQRDRSWGLKLWVVGLSNHHGVVAFAGPEAGERSSLFGGVMSCCGVIFG